MIWTVLCQKWNTKEVLSWFGQLCQGILQAQLSICTVRQLQGIMYTFIQRWRDSFLRVTSFIKIIRPQFMMSSRGLKKMKKRFHVVLIPYNCQTLKSNSLWLILKKRFRDRYPPLAPLLEFRLILQEEWSSISLCTTHDSYLSIFRRILELRNRKVFPHHIKK